jgi:putative peptide zinc metalloprotease protein
MAVILASVAAFDGWLFAVHGVTGALEQILRQPALIFFILALTCLAGAFHEFGHAAACRYSGARPGVVGAGIYLIWPVLYTDVTDAYRLGRAGRLRTDLGGVYCNAVFIAALACAYAVTGYEPLLAAVVFQHLAVLDQLLPWLRLDGYYVISDLTGVPDILSRVRPALRSVTHPRRRDAEILELRPRSRRLLLAYLGSVVAFVLVAAVAGIREAPHLLATDWSSFLARAHGLRVAIGMWDLPGGVLIAVEMALLAAPAIGLVLGVRMLVGQVLHRRIGRAAGGTPDAIRSAALRSA